MISAALFIKASESHWEIKTDLVKTWGDPKILLEGALSLLMMKRSKSVVLTIYYSINIALPEISLNSKKFKESVVSSHRA